MIGIVLLLVADLVPLPPRFGILVVRPAKAAKRIAFGQLYSLKLQHSSGNLISTSVYRDG